MVFDTTVRHFKLFDGTNYVIVGQSAGIVKCFRAFPVFGNDMFKPLSKTKPLTTPLFGLSEVVWSTIIHDYFNPDTPIYKLAVCEGYDVQFPSRYAEGTIVPLVNNPHEKLVNLIEYYQSHPEERIMIPAEETNEEPEIIIQEPSKEPTINIIDYTNYAGVYYDYTPVLESHFFKTNPEHAKQLVEGILLSILKNDLNFHYENATIIYDQYGKPLRMAPPIDHEFSLPFLYPDEPNFLAAYHLHFTETLRNNAAPLNKVLDESQVHASNIIKNIRYIAAHFPNVLNDFNKKLARFINDFQSADFVIPDEYNKPYSTELYTVYEAIYHEHPGSKGLDEIIEPEIQFLDSSYTKIIKALILDNAESLHDNIGYQYRKR